MGDAAGRLPKDHSDVDRKLALNLKCPFYTPEHFFLHKEETLAHKVDGFDPVAFVTLHHGEKEKGAAHTAPCQAKATPAKEQEIIVLVGPPAAGKSTFAHRYFVPHGYVYVNQDTLKTRPACLKLAEASLQQGASVIIGTQPCFVRQR